MYEFEAPIGKGYVTFDGAVLEAWSAGNVDSHDRFHIAVIADLTFGVVETRKITRHYLEITTTYERTAAIGFPPEAKPVMEQVVELVRTAQAQR